MTQEAVQIRIADSYIPVLPETYPRGASRTRDNPEILREIRAYYAENALATDYGYMSYFGLADAFPEASALPSLCDKIFMMQLGDFSNILVGLCEDGIWIKRDQQPWVLEVSVEALPTDSGELVYQEWSYCVLDGIVFCYRAQGSAVYTISSMPRTEEIPASPLESFETSVVADTGSTLPVDSYNLFVSITENVPNASGVYEAKERRIEILETVAIASTERSIEIALTFGRTVSFISVYATAMGSGLTYRTDFPVVDDIQHTVTLDALGIESTINADPVEVLAGTVYPIYPNFLNMQGQQGIFATKLQLGFWDSANSIGLSSIDSYADFTPSIETLAGNVLFPGIQGRIVSVKKHGDGFLVYASRSILYAEQQAGATLEWQSKQLSSEAGVAYQRSIAVADVDSLQYAFTNAGLAKIERGILTFELPAMYDRLKNSILPVYLDFLEGRYLFLQPLDPNFNTSTVEHSTVLLPPAVSEVVVGGCETFATFINAQRADGKTKEGELAILTEWLRGGIGWPQNGCGSISGMPTDMLPNSAMMPIFTQSSSGYADSYKEVWTLQQQNITDFGQTVGVKYVASDFIDPTSPRFYGKSFPAILADLRTQYEAKKLQAATLTPFTFSDPDWVTEDRSSLTGIVAGSTVAVPLRDPALNIVYDCEYHTAYLDLTATSRVYQLYREVIQLDFKELTLEDTLWPVDIYTYNEALSSKQSYIFRYGYVLGKPLPFGQQGADISRKIKQWIIDNLVSAQTLPPNRQPNNIIIGPITAPSVLSVMENYTFISSTVIEDGEVGTWYKHRYNYRWIVTDEMPFYSVGGMTVEPVVYLYNKVGGGIGWIDRWAVPPGCAWLPFTETATQDYRLGSIFEDPSFSLLQTFGSLAFEVPFEDYETGTFPTFNGDEFLSRWEGAIGAAIVDTRFPLIRFPGSAYLKQQGSNVPEYPILNGAFIWDTRLEKWGNLKTQYFHLLNYYPINNRTDKSIAYKTQGIFGGCLNLDGVVKTFEVGYESVLRYGKIAYQLLGFTEAQEIRAEFSSPATGSLILEPSLDGKTVSQNLIEQTSFTDALFVNGQSNLSARWYNLVIVGYFDNTHLEFRGVKSSRR